MADREPTAKTDPAVRPSLYARLRQKAVDYGRLLLSQNLSPARVMTAIILGCIVGCLPLTGVQFFICMGLCRLLGLNLPIMYGAANISLPPIVPFIGWVSVQIGERLLHGQYVTLHQADFARAALPALIKRFFIAWMVGGTIFGGAVGIVGAVAAYIVMTRRRPAPAQEGPVAAAIRRAARRYDGAHPRYRYYARMKYRMDPCYLAIAGRIPAGARVADLGCGLGMLGVALAELGDGRTAWGVDWDAGKIAAGQLAAASLPPGTVTLLQGDVRQVEIPPADAVAIVDVLHYYEPEVQRQLLGRAAASLRPGGQLFVRETDPARAGGARLTRFFERAMVRIGWNRGPRVHYLPLPELTAALASLGLAVELVEVAGATHPGNVLLCAKRGQAPPSSNP